MATETQNIMASMRAYSGQLDAEEAEIIDDSKGLSLLNTLTAGLGMWSATQSIGGFAADALDLRNPMLKEAEKVHAKNLHYRNLMANVPGLEYKGNMMDLPNRYAELSQHIKQFGYGSESMEAFWSNQANQSTNAYTAGTRLTGYGADGTQHDFSAGLNKDYLFGGKYVNRWMTPGWAKGKDHDTLVNKVMGVESGGDPDAVSDVGAHGLMQVMPATAIDPGIAGTDSIFAYAKKHGHTIYEDKLSTEQKTSLAKSLLKDPQINKEFGSDYLKSLINKYSSYGKKGSVERALVAYNAGMSVADDWDGKRASLKYGGGFMKVHYDDQGQVDMTRTEETYNYLNKILGT
tara:strand:+ start:4394 stop:5434 length:1041 start_codon:yes stop_codon:yes gene_type:complete